MSNPRTLPSESSAGYAANRFTGYGGSDEATWKQMELEARAQDAQQALSPALNPVISRLREDLDRLLEDVPGEAEVVGLGITEHMPWDAMALRDALAAMPLIGGTAAPA